MRRSIMRVHFENIKDIIDYVDVGFPPKEDDFAQLMLNVVAEDPLQTIDLPITSTERKVCSEILPHIYDNKRRECRNMIIGAIVSLTAVIAGIIFYEGNYSLPIGNKKNDEYILMDEYDGEWR